MQISVRIYVVSWIVIILYFFFSLHKKKDFSKNIYFIRYYVKLSSEVKTQQKFILSKNLFYE